MQYLDEYCVVVKPLAETLDFLQGETNTYFRVLLSSITPLVNKWEK